eukprot:COSAG04_NODE_6625_length_1290_cov_0.759026_3_plen_85_part_01
MHHLLLAVLLRRQLLLLLLLLLLLRPASGSGGSVVRLAPARRRPLLSSADGRLAVPLRPDLGLHLPLPLRLVASDPQVVRPLRLD